MTPQQWEYRTIDAYTGELYQEHMNRLGAEGWELVSVVFGEWTDTKQERTRVRYIAFFKRPLPLTPAQQMQDVMDWLPTPKGG